MKTRWKNSDVFKLLLHHRLNDPLAHTMACTMKPLCMFLFANTHISSNITLVCQSFRSHAKWSTIGVRNQSNQNNTEKKRCWWRRRQGPNGWESRVNVWMCNVGKRFVVDVIFRWNYSISTPYICSKELFHLLAARDFNQTENSRAYCVDCTNTDLRICTERERESRTSAHKFKACTMKNKYQIHSTYVYFSSKFISILVLCFSLATAKYRIKSDRNWILCSLLLLSTSSLCRWEGRWDFSVVPNQTFPDTHIYCQGV